MTSTAIGGLDPLMDLAADPIPVVHALRFARVAEPEPPTPVVTTDPMAEAVDIRLTPDAALAVYGADPQVAAFIEGAGEVGVKVHQLIPTDKARFRQQALDFAAASFGQTGVPGFRTALQAGQVVVYTVDEMPAGLNVQAPVTLTSYAAGFRRAQIDFTPTGFDHEMVAQIEDEGWNLRQGTLPEGTFFAVWPKG